MSISPQTTRRSWSEFANQPARKAIFLNLVPRLRDYLRERLPDYMVPASFVLLEALPLTPNGKIERRKLPAPERARPPLAVEFVAPRDQNEEQIAAIWAEVLGLDRIGINDDFFELGGHSLLATRVVSRVSDLLNVELSIQKLFENPTIAACSAAVAESGHNAPLRALRRSGATEAPLSFGQQRLWFMDQLVPGTTVYNVPAAISLARGVNLDALEQSLNEIIRRHEALRTTFTVKDAQPVQVVRPKLKLEMPRVDLSKLPQAERDDAVRHWRNDEALTAFDLQHGPLLRATILMLGEAGSILLLTMHHIIADGWSWKVLFNELGVLYRAFANGETSPLAELPIQYGDFVRWQNEWLDDEVIEKQLSYWTKQLSGAPLVLDLPTDRPRPPVQSFRGARESLELSDGLTSKLRKFAKEEKATLFMTMLAAFNVLLHRYTAQEDILVGSPIANRPRPESEQLIGFFLNNLVLRTSLSPTMHFREVVKQVAGHAVSAYANQDLPFEKIVEALNPERDLGRPPIFQVFFNLLNFTETIDLPGLAGSHLTPMEIWSQPSEPGSQFDLTLYAGERANNIQLVLLYNADIFARQRIATMLDQFRFLLEQMVAAPYKPIADYSLLNPESTDLLPDPLLTLAEPLLEPITSTILEQARQLPDHAAIKLGSHTWSYGQLARRAEEIAAMLLADGVRKGEVIAVAGPQGLDLIASMLGVFLSGGVLLTLDRNLPRRRQELMLEQARVGRVLYADDSVSGTGVSPVRLSALPHTGETPVPLPLLEPDDPAYLFFTSGTTGVPKGVLGCHKGLSHFLKWQRERFNLTPADRSAQLTGLSFDVVMRDIFLPLTSGATLVLPEAATQETTEQIVAWLEREQISILHTVPSLAQSWLTNLTEPVSLPCLRCVFFAGEPLTDSLVQQWRTRFGNFGSLVNLYGPTETSLAKCFYVVPDEPSFGVQPVGRALPNAQALVLKGSNLCGIGEPGEIAIRTPFRTLGYINAVQDQQTRFIPNPFKNAKDDVLYLTGDRGRYRPDGQLEILGRLDQQVKIRGVRVEPEEVNAILARHPSVAASIVVPIRDERGENALVAYVVSRVVNSPADVFEARQLREYLEQHLPAALVPTYFVPLEQLPLTANGKVDRRALPLPDLSFANLKEGFIAPRDVTEELIAGVWSEVLGLDQIGIRDSFFELGGHSLRAMQVISRINGIFKIELPLAALFAHSTVEGLAAVIEDHLVDQLESMPEDEAHQLFG